MRRATLLLSGKFVAKELCGPRHAKFPVECLSCAAGIELNGAHRFCLHLELQSNTRGLGKL
jgi:hypothetical protein